jgi:octaprenyl-diphosphate synthase
VLAGDFLYIKSMAMALTQDTLDIVALLCDVTLRMIEGELYQLTKNGVVDLTEEEHFEIIRRKTAYLFGGCAKIGGMLGEVGAEKARRCANTASASASMFQLVDDLARLHRRAEALGKPIGGDLREGKITLPIIPPARKGRAGSRRPGRQCVRDRDIATWNSGRALKAMLAETPLDRSRLQPRRRVRREPRKRQLRLFAPSQEREALMGSPITFSFATASRRLTGAPVDDPAERSRTLRRRNSAARRAVLRSRQPEISDAEFDVLMNELKALEGGASELLDSRFTDAARRASAPKAS